MDAGRENANNTRVRDDVITRENTEYYIYALAEVVNVKKKNYWSLVTRYRIGK